MVTYVLALNFLSIFFTKENIAIIQSVHYLESACVSKSRVGRYHKTFNSMVLKLLNVTILTS